MRFALSEDQVALRDAVRDLLAKECPPEVVRTAWDGAADRGPWDALEAMGVVHALLPEDRGGMGFTELELAPIIEEAGRVALPFPLVETALVGLPLLGPDAGLVAVSWDGPLTPYATIADTLLVHRDGRLWALPAAAASLTPAPTVDHSRAVGSLSWPAVQDLAELVTEDPAAVALAEDRGVLGTAALLVGLAQAMLDLTVSYVTERKQFGQPIGSFQAVKHHLANAALAIEFARPAVWRAAWSSAQGEPTRTRDASMAKVLATQAADVAGRAGLQCHGAIGYTVEADLHLFQKRAWALARTWGDVAHHTDRVASALHL